MFGMMLIQVNEKQQKLLNLSAIYPVKEFCVKYQFSYKE